MLAGKFIKTRNEFKKNVFCIIRDPKDNINAVVSNMRNVSNDIDNYPDCALFNQADKGCTYRFTLPYNKVHDLIRNCKKVNILDHIKYKISIYRIFDYPKCELVEKIDHPQFREFNMLFKKRGKRNKVKKKKVRNPNISMRPNSKPQEFIFNFVPRFDGIGEKRKVAFFMKLEFFYSSDVSNAIHTGGILYRNLHSHEKGEEVDKNGREFNCALSWGWLLSKIDNLASDFKMPQEDKITITRKSRKKKAKKKSKMFENDMNYKNDVYFGGGNEGNVNGNNYLDEFGFLKEGILDDQIFNQNINLCNNYIGFEMKESDVDDNDNSKYDINEELFSLNGTFNGGVDDFGELKEENDDNFIDVIDPSNEYDLFRLKNNLNEEEMTSFDINDIEF